MKYKLGQLVLLKKGFEFVRCVVIDVDATFVTLRMEYKKGIGTDFKLNVNDKNIIRINNNSKEAYKANTEAFECKNNNFLA